MTATRRTILTTRIAASMGGVLCAAMLTVGGLAACTPTEEPTADPPAASDQGGDASGSGDESSDAGSDDTSDGGGDESSDGGGAEESDTAGVMPLVLFVTEGLNDTVDTSAQTWTLDAEKTAAALTVAGIKDASCEGELRWEQDAPLRCSGTPPMEGGQTSGELTVYGVRAPSGWEKEGQPAMIVSVGNGLDASTVQTITDPANQLVGVGQGSMFGSSDLTEEELVAAVDTTVNSGGGYVPLEGEMTVSGCDGPMPARTTSPVTCTAAWTHSPDAQIVASAVPVVYLDSDPGLLVALRLGD